MFEEPKAQTSEWSIDKLLRLFLLFNRSRVDPEEKPIPLLRPFCIQASYPFHQSRLRICTEKYAIFASFRITYISYITFISSRNHCFLVHNWNSYWMPFSSWTPSGTLNPTHFSKSSWDPLFHASLPVRSRISWNSGMKTSHSKAGERMRVRRMELAVAGSEKFRASEYRDAPPMTKHRCSVEAYWEERSSRASLTLVHKWAPISWELCSSFNPLDIG